MTAERKLVWLVLLLSLLLPLAAVYGFRLGYEAHPAAGHMLIVEACSL